MSAFLDASLIVAVLAPEADWDVHADRCDEEDVLLWSGIARWEAIMGLRRVQERSFEEAAQAVDDFARQRGVTMVPIAEREAAYAVAAFQSFGKGTGHPARLNMGDCFAYACAKANDARLLYKGNDFAQTDLA